MINVKILLSALLIFPLAACNMASLTIKDNDASTEIADSDQNENQQLPTLLPPWSKSTRLKNPEHTPDTFVELDPFLFRSADFPVQGYDIIWDRIRAGFTLPRPDHRKVKSELHWFASHNDYLNRVADRAEPFLHFIMEEIDKRNMPAEIALLPIVESAFQPFAYSHGQAAGIWQFIPSTGRHYGLKQNWWYDGRRDVYASTIAALDYLNFLARAFDGNWLHALAAYNSGIGTVTRAIKRNKRLNKPTDFWHLKLPKETQGYVPKLIALANLVAEPEKYNVDLKCIKNAPYFEVVNTESQIDLAVAADLAGISLEELYRLNPGNNRWATDPKGPHRLILPIENVEQFKSGLETIPGENRVTWKRYKVKDSETLSQIAMSHHVTVDQLKRINNLRSNSIRAGKHLIIPVASKKQAAYALSKLQREKHRRAIIRQGKGNKIIHTVRSGDSLWDISQLYRVGLNQVARWNGLSPKDILRAGQKLVVWTKKKITNNRINSSVVGDFIRSIQYRVRNGDSLYRIANKFNVSVNDLQRWNPIEGKYLKPGQTLKLYVDITKQANNS